MPTPNSSSSKHPEAVPTPRVLYSFFSRRSRPVRSPGTGERRAPPPQETRTGGVPSEPSSVLRGHGDGLASSAPDVYSVTFHSGDTHVVTAGHDRTVRLYDVESAQVNKSILPVFIVSVVSFFLFGFFASYILAFLHWYTSAFYTFRHVAFTLFRFRRLNKVHFCIFVFCVFRFPSDFCCLCAFFSISFHHTPSFSFFVQLVLKSSVSLLFCFPRTGTLSPYTHLVLITELCGCCSLFNGVCHYYFPRNAPCCYHPCHRFAVYRPPLSNNYTRTHGPSPNRTILWGEDLPSKGFLRVSNACLSSFM